MREVRVVMCADMQYGQRVFRKTEKMLHLPVFSDILWKSEMTQTGFAAAVISMIARRGILKMIRRLSRRER